MPEEILEKNKTATLEDAIQIAAEAHKDIKDKAGAHYCVLRAKG